MGSSFDRNQFQQYWHCLWGFPYLSFVFSFINMILFSLSHIQCVYIYIIQHTCIYYTQYIYWKNIYLSWGNVNYKLLQNMIIICLDKKTKHLIIWNSTFFKGKSITCTWSYPHRLSNTVLSSISAYRSLSNHILFVFLFIKTFYMSCNLL